RRAHRGGVLEFAQLTLDVPAELRAVLTLELTQLLELALELGLLLLEGAELAAGTLLGLGDDARRGGVARGDERVALLHALANVLLVESTGELEQIVGVPGIHRVRVEPAGGGEGRLLGRRHGGRGRLLRLLSLLRGTALQLRHPRLTGD